MNEYELIKIFKALADKTRQDILQLLGEEEMNVGDICAEFHTSQPTISHHLHILKECDLVDHRKEGKNIYYYVRKEIISDAFGRVNKKIQITIKEEK